MTRVPLTLVVALFLITLAEWPSVAAWSELTDVHHALVHGLFLVAGGLFGLQIAWWTRLSSREAWASQEEDSEVSS
ncbi:hypothetical protein NZD89_05505 [Alicyclobacillus fastidiosus]|uniref:Uncharacterized protein n=1 Tax=Alicyclobacillus fastidiosus TaxID=392011 RepID=A0ABY6ZIY1_9BACL|nr:hypothetical protein [Alicyclobacillus fastidiosus]WAH42885.1 hypothetical protein NZD89_05505 [Alicyclobacillus fastidiosus]GMA64825.1 hypothetical protein GCM10025859_52650 [Alicyclobacillus fastidiosus]